MREVKGLGNEGKGTFVKGGKTAGAEPRRHLQTLLRRADARPQSCRAAGVDLRLGTRAPVPLCRVPQGPGVGTGLSGRGCRDGTGWVSHLW